MWCVFVRLCEHVSESIYTYETEVFGFTFRFCDFWLIFFSILALRCWLCCCFAFVNAPVVVWLQRKCRENWNLNKNKIGEKEWYRDRRNVLKFFVLSSLITECLHFMNFSGFSFLCFGGILGFFSLWVGDGGIWRCIWGWVGICSNKSGEFCIWGYSYSIEGVGVSVLAEFVRGMLWQVIKWQ